MKVFGIVGWSGNGKTTLVRRLLPELIGRGYRVSTIKHTHHNFDIDKPGKDTYAHRQAGAHEVLICGGNRWALLHEHRGAPEPDMESLLARMEDVDLVLVEGFKKHTHAKIEVHREIVEKPLLWENDKMIVAIASDEPIHVANRVRLNLEDVTGIADFILDYCGLTRRVDNGAA
jgi:molybdopterin-guanine dinucleotide biosynthesis protein B